MGVTKAAINYGYGETPIGDLTSLRLKGGKRMGKYPKGSAEARAYMAYIRSLRGKTGRGRTRWRTAKSVKGGSYNDAALMGGSYNDAALMGGSYNEAALRGGSYNDAALIGGMDWDKTGDTLLSLGKTLGSTFKTMADQKADEYLAKANETVSDPDKLISLGKKYLPKAKDFVTSLIGKKSKGKDRRSSLLEVIMNMRGTPQYTRFMEILRSRRK